MTVHVDDVLREAAGRNDDPVVRDRRSRLLADDTSELLAFGSRLGLPRSQLRKPGTHLEHFDLTADKRRSAIKLGAVPITAGEGEQLIRAKRAGVPFDLHQLRTDPRAFDTALDLPAVRLPPGGPVRVRLSRARGYRLPPHTVSVAAPTRWANPFRPAARTPAANQAAVEHFTAYLRRNPTLVEQARVELRGLNLACWCAAHLPCHADVWLTLVNTTRVRTEIHLPGWVDMNGPA